MFDFWIIAILQKSTTLLKKLFYLKHFSTFPCFQTFSFEVFLITKTWFVHLEAPKYQENFYFPNISSKSLCLASPLPVLRESHLSSNLESISNMAIRVWFFSIPTLIHNSIYPLRKWIERKPQQSLLLPAFLSNRNCVQRVSNHHYFILPLELCPFPLQYCEKIDQKNVPARKKKRSKICILIFEVVVCKYFDVH